MLKSVTKVCNSYFVHTFGVLFKRGVAKVQNLDSQCVQGCDKCVQGAENSEKCVQSV